MSLTRFQQEFIEEYLDTRKKGLFESVEPVEDVPIPHDWGELYSILDDMDFGDQIRLKLKDAAISEKARTACYNYASTRDGVKIRTKTVGDGEFIVTKLSTDGEIKVSEVTEETTMDVLKDFLSGLPVGELQPVPEDACYEKVKHTYDAIRKQSFFQKEEGVVFIPYRKDNIIYAVKAEIPESNDAIPPMLL